MDLSQIPAVAPPPGAVSNLVDPPSEQVATIAICAVLVPLVVLFVGGRIFHNVHVVHRVGIDDYSCLVALVLSFTFLSLILHQSYFFRHEWNVPVSWFTADSFKITVASSLLLGPAAFFAKASLLLLYLKVFAATSRSYRVKIYITLAFCFCLYFVNVPLTAYFCTPRKSQTWTSPQVFSSCASTLPFGITQGVLNVVVDFWILWLPLPVLWRLKLAKAKKIGIIAIFMTGFLACAASVVGLCYRVIVWRTKDVTWNDNILYIAIIFEINISILVSATPAFASLIKLMLQNERLTVFFRSVHTGRWTGIRSKTSNSSSYPVRNHFSSSTHIRNEAYIELGGGPGTAKRAPSESANNEDKRVKDTRAGNGIMRSVNMEVSYS